MARIRVYANLGISMHSEPTPSWLPQVFDIPVGAAALFGCHKLGRFDRSAAQLGSAVASSRDQLR